MILQLLEDRADPTVDHRLVAPTLIRSEVLDALYREVRSGRLEDDVGRDRLRRFSHMKIRYLGDAVLRRRAWLIAEEMGWESTSTAEYVALTQLQADAFITTDTALAASLDGIVVVASIEVLR